MQVARNLAAGMRVFCGWPLQSQARRRGAINRMAGVGCEADAGSLTRAWLECGMAKSISGGGVRDLFADMRKALTSDARALAAWESPGTPLARNEWICWTTAVKKAETRAEHVMRTVSQLKEGQRRPRCWPGLPGHRNPNAAKYFKKVRASRNGTDLLTARSVRPVPQAPPARNARSDVRTGHQTNRHGAAFARSANSPQAGLEPARLAAT